MRFNNDYFFEYHNFLVAKTSAISLNKQVSANDFFQMFETLYPEGDRQISVCSRPSQDTKDVNYYSRNEG